MIHDFRNRELFFELLKLRGREKKFATFSNNFDIIISLFLDRFMQYASSKVECFGFAFMAFILTVLLRVSFWE